MAEDTRLRFRIYAGGRLADETWVDGSVPGAAAEVDAVSARHQVIAAAAASEGFTWMMEVYDPASPPDLAYVRIGTGAGGMIAPVPLPGGTLEG